MKDLRYLFPHIDYKKVSLSIGVIAFLFLLIVTFIPIDITAKGDGRTVVSNTIRNIQATESTTVHKVYVHENQSVKKGELLIELDSKLLENELKNLEHMKIMILLENERINALLSKRVPNFETLTSEKLLILSSLNIYEQEKNTFDAKKMSLENQILSKKEEEKTLEESIKLFQQLSASAKDYLDRLIKLIKKDVLSKISKYDIQKQYIDASSHLQMQKTSLRSAINMRMAYEQELESLQSDFEKTNQLKLEENIKNINGLNKDIANLKDRIKKMKIYARSDGIIFNLIAHDNEVVTASQIMAQIVPKDDAIEVEAIMNKSNCGLIEVGNEAIVKLQTFPYQIYGTLKGKVRSIAPVSTNEITKQSGISIRIKLKKQYIETEKNVVKLKPLMPLEAVVTVNRTPIIKYLLMYMSKKFEN